LTIDFTFSFPSLTLSFSSALLDAGPTMRVTRKVVNYGSEMLDGAKLR
jgi:hypothetical protein